MTHVYAKTWPEYRILNPLAAVAVPSDFVGIHANRWPTAAGYGGSDDPAPTYGFGAFRNWDANHSFDWSTLQPTSGGGFDFTKSDTYLAPYFAQGKTITWCFGHTPTWAAQVPNQSRADPYGQLGGSSPPASWAVWEAFVSAVATKYAGKIKRYEIWNEPSYTNTLNSFFWGTAAELVEMAYRARTVIKAFDSAAEVWSPSFTGGVYGANVQGFLNGQDPTSGKFGREIIDGLALHPYGGTPTPGFDVPGDEPKIDAARQGLLAVGAPASVKIGFHEIGISSTTGTQVLNDWLALTPALRKQGMMRRMMVAAARGISQYMVYAHGSTLSADLRTDYDGVCAALNEIHTRLSGKTIAIGQGLFYADGRVVLTLTDGSTIAA